jgi:single stranded DNA-binding protein
MNALRNKVSLIGRLGAQPEVVTLDSGRVVARFSMATNESYKGKDGEWKENTAIVWGLKLVREKLIFKEMVGRKKVILTPSESSH